MRYSEEDLETLDVDWFALDEGKHIAHFASAGAGFVPESIMSSVEDNDSIFDAIDRLPQICEAEILQDNIPQFDEPNSQHMYVSAFMKIACKGIYSYDVSAQHTNEYVMIARPKTSLKIDELPESIAKLIEQTSLRKSLFELNEKIFSEML